MKASEFISEKWTQKYKKSINCSSPKGFSQKAHCAGRKKNEGVAEGKIKLSTDPNWYGAEVDDYKASGPIVNIPADRLVGFEPDGKMNQPASKANVEKIVAGLKQGTKLPPLLVRQYKNGYQVLDGHHRFWAYKLLGVKSIPAQVVPAEDIEEIIKQGMAEGELDEDLRKWFKQKWVRFGPDGKIRGDCARGSEKEGKPKCLPQAKAHALGKKGRASAAARKRREDPNANRSGPAINVSTKGKRK